MRSISVYDPDEETRQKYQAWQIPKTPLAIRALSACNRKYFHGTTKHNSDYDSFSKLEVKTVGAGEESYLFKRWIENCCEWAEGKNGRGTTISFSALLHLMGNEEVSKDWIVKNRTRMLKERADGRELDIDEFISKQAS